MPLCGNLVIVRVQEAVVRTDAVDASDCVQQALYQGHSTEASRLARTMAVREIQNIAWQAQGHFVQHILRPIWDVSLGPVRSLWSIADTAAPLR